MFYLYELPRKSNDQPITIADHVNIDMYSSNETGVNAQAVDEDVDFVDDTLLNPAPHNAIEHQLLRGDMVGLALMSSAILWSAMGAFG
ncbi:hypothetical protein [Chenggangzhangella methanolivorans]|uniref:Uncharacterized protein n=1 Tax=Chenggangzhangella methanolivorans TaxID=1437009 RepID=A0A9E6RF77_9HYPH|nr:hypothetical protein [Chenggangzhangella methanolivorans]QZN99856.1 hypothetical protein K6K41_24935 [Chenggangzhangella methanolivorans]